MPHTGFRRELPYSLVVGALLLGGLWLTLNVSAGFLALMLLGVAIAAVRAVVTVRRDWRGPTDDRR